MVAMKSQFFLLGGILIIVLFFAGLPLFNPLIGTASRDIEFFVQNVEKELPVALNHGLNRSASIDTMVNFTHFLEDKLAGHFINYTSLWIVSENSSTNVNMTVGNFLGFSTIVALNLSGTVQNVSLATNTTNSTVFTSPGTSFNLTIQFQSQSKTVEWLRDKVNLYAYINITREKTIIKEEIVS